MITTRALRPEEPEQRPQQVIKEPEAPPIPTVKYATIHRGNKRFNSGTGRYEMTIQAIDTETSEVVISKTIRHISLTPSQLISGEGIVMASAIEAGYTLEY